jgi:hypothetical protein
LFSGARTVLRTVTAPAQSKVYTVINATTGGFSVKLVGSGPTTGLTIPNGASAVVAWNGSDFVEIGAGSIGNLVVNGTLTVTGATTLQSTLAVTGNITNTAGTANGVAYLNGSKVVTSGSALVFDATNTALSVGGSATNTAANRGNISINGTSTAILSLSTGASAKGYVYHSGSDMIINATMGTLALQANGNGALIDTSGNLGLGVTPSAWSSGKAFEVGRVGNAIWNLDPNETYFLSNAYFNSGFKYGATGTATYYLQFSGQHRWYNAPSGTAGNNITFTQAMTLDASGNLGIGTTSPEANGRLTLDRASSNYLMLRSGGTNRMSLYVDSGVSVVDAQANPLVFNAGSAERARIDSSGNFGLGVTPSAWSIRALQVGSGYAAWSSGVTNARMFANTYYDGSYRYIGTGRATQYEQDGYHAWFTAPSGTAGNAITFTQAMTLDASGNLGIGTTNPSTRLHVAGTAQNSTPYITFETTSANNSFNWVSTAFASNMTSTANLIHFIGQSGSNKNAAYFGFKYDSSGSNNNLLTMGLFSADNLLNINGYGNVSLSGATTTANGVGITFPATQSASSDANCLDDYEEGTWTPSLSSDGGGSSATYNFISGRYRKIGSTVIAWWGLNVATWTAGSGTVQITGLPFAGITTGSYQESNVNITSGQWASAYAAYAGSTYFFNGSGSTTMFGRFMNNVDTTMSPAAIQGGSASVGTYMGGVMIYIAS